MEKHMTSLNETQIKAIAQGNDTTSIKDLEIVMRKYLKENTFNNLEILLSDASILSLNIDHLLDKILQKREGGYCFEHNKLFFHYLKSSGFDCQALLARVVYARDIDAPRTHRFSIITLDKQRYLVDVGFGPYTPSRPIPLDTKRVKCQNDMTYKVLNSDNGTYKLVIEKESKDFVLYTFTIAETTESDFNLANYYTNTHPSSKFVNELIVSKRTDTHVIFITNLSYVTLSKDKRQTIEITNSAQLKQILSNDFNIDITMDQANKVYNHISKN